MSKRNCWRIAGELLVCAFVGVAIAFILLGWLYGCGEHYVDAQGKTHIIECPKLFVSRTPPPKDRGLDVAIALVIEPKVLRH